MRFGFLFPMKLWRCFKNLIIEVSFQLAIEGKETKTHFPTRCISIWIFSPFFTMKVEDAFRVKRSQNSLLFFNLVSVRKTILFLFSHVSLSMDSRSSINYAWNYIRDQIEIWFKYIIET